MKTEIKTLSDLAEFVNDSEGYMAGITLLKDGNLTHYFFSDNFPYLDMLKSHTRVKGLIINKLEEDPRITS